MNKRIYNHDIKYLLKQQFTIMILNIFLSNNSFLYSFNLSLYPFILLTNFNFNPLINVPLKFSLKLYIYINRSFTIRQNTHTLKDLLAS